jgi:hypothetical protein
MQKQAKPVCTTSVFYPPALRERIRKNIECDPWSKEFAQGIVAAAEPFRRMADDELWSLMFGSTLPRSWMVLSNGDCPSCHQPVPLYDWKIDAIHHPWKLHCPHCAERFPKNDFEKFHRSGLNRHGIFDFELADRSLLFNTEHPDPTDPLHLFGVDDGTGYIGESHWRFIPTYLVFGQWKQLVHGGIKRLASAYVVTGDEAYAHKASLLLDRVADLHPDFDFKTQGVVYETIRSDGYISVWHDTNIETLELTLAYDAIRPGVEKDEALAAFLAKKSHQYQTPRRKENVADIIANIEERILKDALAHPEKIYTNFPQRELLIVVIKTVLGGSADLPEVKELLDSTLREATAYDGTTGEKGLSNYCAFASQRTAEILGYYSRADEKFLPELVRRNPRLPEMYRFFIDTYCNGRYYPTCGDANTFAAPKEPYVGVVFEPSPFPPIYAHKYLYGGVLASSMYSLLWEFGKITGDPAFAQIIYKSNKNSLENLPYDLAAPDAKGMRRDLERILEASGSDIQLSSVNKSEWHLAILRAGKDETERTLWLDYDSRGNHSHADGMNLGLYAHGLDLMPDFGYCPVQFGGWKTPQSLWYKSTASHNTVMVDNANQAPADGKTTLWAAGQGFGAIAASAPEMIWGPAPGGFDGHVYSRTAALIDIDDRSSYVFDIFRVRAGDDHAKGFGSHFGSVCANGIHFNTPSDFTHPQMRNLRMAVKARPGWSVDWEVNDYYKLLPPEKRVGLRYTDFTTDADVYLGEAWVVAGINTYSSTDEQWVPRVLVRRRGKGPFLSTFVSLIEPHEGTAKITTSARLPLQLPDGKPAGDGCVALSVGLPNGERDVLISLDESTTSVIEPGTGIAADCKLCQVRLNARGEVIKISACRGTSLRHGGREWMTSASGDYFEMRTI